MWSRLHNCEWLTLEAHSPGGISKPIGILLREVDADRLHIRVRENWWKLNADPLEEYIWAGLHEELIERVGALGAEALLQWLEDTASHAIRISRRHPIQSVDAVSAVDKLFRRYCTDRSWANVIPRIQEGLRKNFQYKVRWVPLVATAACALMLPKFSQTVKQALSLISHTQIPTHQRLVTQINPKSESLSNTDFGKGSLSDELQHDQSLKRYQTSSRSDRHLALTGDALLNPSGNKNMLALLDLKLPDELAYSDSLSLWQLAAGVNGTGENTGSNGIAASSDQSLASPPSSNENSVGDVSGSSSGAPTFGGPSFLNSNLASSTPPPSGSVGSPRVDNTPEPQVLFELLVGLALLGVPNCLRRFRQLRRV